MAQVLVFAALTALLSGCGKPVRRLDFRPLPGQWPTYMSNLHRSAFLEVTPPGEVEIAWREAIGRGLINPMIPNGDALIIPAANRRVVAIDTETGDSFWEESLDGPATGGAVWNGSFIVTADDRRRGNLRLLDPATGDKRWEKRVGAVAIMPLIHRDTIFVGTEGGNLFAFDIHGEQLWRRRLGAAAASTPVPWGHFIAVASKADTLLLVSRATGMVETETPLPATVTAPPALVDDLLYLPLYSGELVAYELPSLHERWRRDLGSPIYSAPSVDADGVIWVLTNDAEVWRLPPDGSAAERVVALTGAARGSLTLARDHLLVGRLDGILFLLRRDGSIVWQKDMEDSIAAPVTLHQGAIFVPLLGGDLVKLSPEDPSS